MTDHNDSVNRKGVRTQNALEISNSTDSPNNSNVEYYTRDTFSVELDILTNFIDHI